jgi:hypothetical protein
MSASVLSWTEALLRPGRHSLYESMVTGLAEYLGETPATVAAASAAGAESIAEEWDARKHLCDGLSMNALHFGGNHSSDSQPPDQAPVDCIS